MANSEEFLQEVLGDLKPLGDVTTRPMFGGHGVFLDGRMFALISGDVLYFKADDENRSDFEAFGMKPYGKMPYYQTPPAAMDDPNRLEYYRWRRRGGGGAGRQEKIQREKGPENLI